MRGGTVQRRAGGRIRALQSRAELETGIMGLCSFERRKGRDDSSNTPKEGGGMGMCLLHLCCGQKIQAKPAARKIQVKPIKPLWKRHKRAGKGGAGVTRC